MYILFFFERNNYMETKDESSIIKERNNEVKTGKSKGLKKENGTNEKKEEKWRHLCTCSCTILYG